MSILKVVKMGHPVLRSVAQEVVFPLSDDIKTLINDMKDTLADENGAGLAAPQVAASQRIVIALLDGETPTILINPVLTIMGEEMDWAFEGCLSLPGLRGAVPRYTQLSWQAQDCDGNTISGEAHDFSARLLQHEVDHLDGILYPDRMPDLRLLTYLDELHNFMPDNDSGDLEGEDHD